MGHMLLMTESIWQGFYNQYDVPKPILVKYIPLYAVLQLCDTQKL